MVRSTAADGGTGTTVLRRPCRRGLREVCLWSGLQLAVVREQTVVGTVAVFCRLTAWTFEHHTAPSVALLCAWPKQWAENFRQRGDRRSSASVLDVFMAGGNCLQS